MVKKAKGPGQVDTQERVAEMIATLKLLDHQVGSVPTLTDTEDDVLDAVSECLDGAVRGLKRFLAHREEQARG